MTADKLHSWFDDPGGRNKEGLWRVLRDGFLGLNKSRNEVLVAWLVFGISTAADNRCLTRTGSQWDPRCDFSPAFCISSIPEASKLKWVNGGLRCLIVVALCFITPHPLRCFVYATHWFSLQESFKLKNGLLLEITTGSRIQSDTGIGCIHGAIHKSRPTIAIT